MGALSFTPAQTDPPLAPLKQLLSAPVCTGQCWKDQQGLILLHPWLVTSSGVAGLAVDFIPPSCSVCCVVLF